MINEGNLTERIGALVQKTLSAMILHPKDLELKPDALGRVIIYRAKVHRDDMRRIIGIKGGNVRAIQTLTRMVAERNGVTIRYEVLEPTMGTEGKNPPFTPKDRWNSGPAKAIAVEWIEMLAEFPVQVKILDGNSFDSVCQIDFSKQENIGLTADIKESLGEILVAIGRVNGRRLTVDAARTL